MKKLLAMVLALCLALGTLALTACGGGQDYVDPGDDYDVNIDFSDEDYQQTATLTVGVTVDHRRPSTYRLWRPASRTCSPT